MQIQLDFRSQDVKNCPSSPFLITSICNTPVYPQTACIHCTPKLWISVQLISCRLSQTLGCATCLKLKTICFVSICSHIKQNWNATLLWKIYSNSIYQRNVIGKYHIRTSTQMDFFASLTCLGLSILLGNGISGHAWYVEMMLLVKE